MAKRIQFKQQGEWVVCTTPDGKVAHFMAETGCVFVEYDRLDGARQAAIVVAPTGGPLRTEGRPLIEVVRSLHAQRRLPNPPALGRSKAYAVIYARAEALGLPKMWRTDVTLHDARNIEEYSDCRFLWGVRETGSYLIPLTTEYDSPRELSRVFWAAQGSFPETQWHYWNGHDLHPVTFDEGAELLKALDSSQVDK